MIEKINVPWFVLGFAVALVGCGRSSPTTDVTEYFGKSEEEIKEMLGEPSGRGGSEAQARLQQMDRQLMQEYFQEKRLVYRQEVSPLPEPLVTLELIIPKDGVCRQVLGQTRGFDNPEELLEAIGLGHLDKEEKSRDQLGVSYTIPPYTLVQVHRPSSMVRQYKNFNISR